MKNFATTLEMNNSAVHTAHLQSLTNVIRTSGVQFLGSLGLLLLMLGRFALDSVRAIILLIVRTAFRLTSALQKAFAACFAFRPLHALSSLFSLLMGERLSENQTLRILSLSLSAISALLFGGISLFVQILLIAWFIFSVWQCRRI